MRERREFLWLYNALVCRYFAFFSRFVLLCLSKMENSFFSFNSFSLSTHHICDGIWNVQKARNSSPRQTYTFKEDAKPEEFSSSVISFHKGDAFESISKFHVIIHIFCPILKLQDKGYFQVRKNNFYSNSLIYSIASSFWWFTAWTRYVQVVKYK